MSLIAKNSGEDNKQQTEEKNNIGIIISSIIIIIPKNINIFNHIIHSKVNFLLPFMGFGFNYTWLSLHGHISFRFFFNIFFLIFAINIDYHVV